MRGIVVSIGVTVGVLWLADVLLNDGRYGDVIERGIMTLVGK
jgi:hypothetical protein